MTVYKIRNWDEDFENNRTRDMKNMNWVPVPNSHDGDGYTTLVSRENGAAFLGAWLVILQLASKCAPRGTLLRSGGKPHDSASISRITRLPEKLITETLKVCTDEIQWIEKEQLSNAPQEGAEIPQEGALFPHPTDEEGKGREGKKEGKGTSEKLPLVEKTKGTIEEVKIFCLSIELPTTDAEWFFYKCQGNGWKNNGEPIKDWKATIRAWKVGGFMPSQKVGFKAQAAASTTTGADKVILGKEYERTNARMETIRSTYGDMQTWSQDDKTELAKLKLRKKELQQILGIQS